MADDIDEARILRIMEGVEKPPLCQELSLAGRRRETVEDVWVCPTCDKANPHGYSWPDHLHGPDRSSPWGDR